MKKKDQEAIAKLYLESNTSKIESEVFDDQKENLSTIRESTDSDTEEDFTSILSFYKMS